MPGPLCYRRQPLRRRIVLLALALGAVGFLPAKAEAAAGFAPCASAASIECATVAVPLDRTGALPGTVSLHVERSVPPTGASRGVMLLLAGGPGQPNANVFGLAQSAAGLRTLFPGYTLATYDVRGTGASDPLSCPALQSLLQSSDEQQSAKLVGDCGALLPDSRRFYSTRDHAEDIDAVRQALGVDRIALYGTSYGTKLEMAYALEFPDHVDRLLLDSVVPPEGHGPFGTDTLQAIPGALAQYCENSRCKAATPDFAGEVVALANRLGATPLRGSILVGAGSTRTQRLDGYQFLSLVVDADLNPGVAAELPAAVHAALHGEPRPLLRLEQLDTAGSLSADSLNAALFAATTCDDGGLPWQSDVPVAARQPLLDSAVAALPAGSTGPFGPWATAIGDAAFYRFWPAEPPSSSLVIHPLPDVPVLVLAGGRDTRTPAAGAAEVAARFPHGHLVVVPGIGHSVLGADASGCAVRAVVDWMHGASTFAQCTRPRDIVSPLEAFPGSVGALRATGRLPGRVGRTATAVLRTVREAGAIWAASQFGLGGVTGPIAGVYGGHIAPAGADRFTLVRYTVIPGVQVSGSLSVDKTDWLYPFRFAGIVSVGGAKAAAGRVHVDRHRIQGNLGGRVLNVAVG